jgi:hypothetical protein
MKEQLVVKEVCGDVGTIQFARRNFLGEYKRKSGAGWLKMTARTQVVQR